MSKLFSLEADRAPNAELLIDKVIRQADKNKEGLQVTADLIKQRQVLKQEIDKELQQSGPPEDPSPYKVEEGASEDAEGDDQKEQGGDSGEVETDAGADSEETQEAPSKKPGEEDTQGDATEVAQSADDLEALVGSDHQKKEAGEGAAAEKGSVSKESFQGTSVIPTQLFTGIMDKHRQYVVALEEYNLTPQGRGAKDQNVAYVKEEVLSSLKTMTTLSNRYIAKNAQQGVKTHKALLSLSEKLTVYQSCHEAGKLHLTLKAVEDEAVMRAIGIPGSTDLKETSGLLVKYLDEVTVLVAKVLENDLTTLSGSLTDCGYRSEEGIYTYHKTLPGFVVPKASCVEYQDYLHTKYSDYQAYRHQSFKTEELYNLNAISLNKDSVLTSVLERLSSLTVHGALMVDNLKEVSSQYSALIEKVKATCFDIEQDKVKQLADLDIDARLKDFIRFKMASELYNNAIDLSLAYVTATLTAFSGLIELSE